MSADSNLVNCWRRWPPRSSRLRWTTGNPYEYLNLGTVTPLTQHKIRKDKNLHPINSTTHQPMGDLRVQIHQHLSPHNENDRVGTISISFRIDPFDAPTSLIDIGRAIGDDGSGATVILPLVVKGEVAGAMVCRHDNPEDVDPTRLVFARQLADQTAMAISTALPIEENRALAMQPPSGRSLRCEISP